MLDVDVLRLLVLLVDVMRVVDVKEEELVEDKDLDEDEDLEPGEEDGGVLVEIDDDDDDKLLLLLEELTDVREKIVDDIVLTLLAEIFELMALYNSSLFPAPQYS